MAGAPNHTIINNNMIKEDFHGYRLGDAIHEAELLISEIRDKRQSRYVQFITGHGIIRDSLIDLFEQYGLKAEISWNNSGMISVLIE